MNDAVKLLRALPLRVFETPKPNDAWARCSLAAASDEILIQSVAAAVTCPKVHINSSFLLHAPLELLARVLAERLRATLAEKVLPSLGAAGHASILLMMLPGAAERLPGLGALLRSPLRALALQSSLRLTRMDTVAPSTKDATPELFARLAALPSRIEVSSNFIAPTMLAVERDGYAASVLASATNAMTEPQAERILLRVAALSLLQDDPAHAPYGWSHCFTIPQAILSQADVAADVTRVVRIAATHVLGFRATLSSAPLQHPYESECHPNDTASQRYPADAAAIAFNAKDDELRSIKARLIERAAAHADAHLAKYTVACLVAAERDPQQSPLYLAAAAYLGAWWDHQ